MIMKARPLHLSVARRGARIPGLPVLAFITHVRDGRVEMYYNGTTEIRTDGGDQIRIKSKNDNLLI